jgi:hypothetical protein
MAPGELISRPSTELVDSKCAETCRPASARAISASSDDGEISAAALATAQGLFTLQSFTSRLQVWT